MRKLFPLLVAFFILGISDAQAQVVPDYFLIQGRLVKADLEAHSGLYDFRVSLWGDADANDSDTTDMSGAIWSEERSVEVSANGFFEFKMGDTTPLPSPFSFDTLKYLQIDAKSALGADYVTLDPLRENSEIDRLTLMTIPYRSSLTEGPYATLDENGKLDESVLPDSLNQSLLSLSSRISSTENSIASYAQIIEDLQQRVTHMEKYAHRHVGWFNSPVPIASFSQAFQAVDENIQLFEDRIVELEQILETARNNPSNIPSLEQAIGQTQNQGNAIEREVERIVNDQEDYSGLKKRVDRIAGALTIIERYEASDQLSKERITKLENFFSKVEDRMRLIETTPRVIKLGEENITAESILLSNENSEDIITLENKIIELEDGLRQIAEINEELSAIKAIVEINEERISALEERENTRSWKDPVSSLEQLNAINGQEGEIRYVVDEKSLQVYDGDDWNGIGGGETGSLKQNTYSFAQIINIHTKREAQPGLFYWDRGNKQYFVGMADGSLKSLFSDVPLPGFVQQDEWIDLRFTDIAQRGFEKTDQLQYMQDDRLGLGLRSGYPNSWNQGMAIPELAFERDEEKIVEFVFYSGSLDGRMMLGVGDSETTSINRLGKNGFKHQKFALYMQSGSFSNKIFGQESNGKTWSNVYHKKNSWKRNSFYRFSFQVDGRQGIKGNFKIDQVDEKNFDQVITTIADQPVPDLSFTGKQLMPLWITHGNNSYRLAAVRIKDAQ